MYMSRKLKVNKPFLLFILDGANRQQALVLLDSVNQQQANVIFEIFHNLIQGVFRLSTSQKSNLARHKSLLRAISDQQNSLQQKQRIIKKRKRTVWKLLQIVKISLVRLLL